MSARPVMEPLLWTTVDEGLDGLVLRVRGRLSSATAPALDSLLQSLAEEGVSTLDLSEADVVEPAGARLLERWPTSAGTEPHTYRFRTSAR